MRSAFAAPLFIPKDNVADVIVSGKIKVLERDKFLIGIIVEREAESS
jgi:hypothetical protein